MNMQNVTFGYGAINISKDQHKPRFILTSDVTEVKGNSESKKSTIILNRPIAIMNGKKPLSVDELEVNSSPIPLMNSITKADTNGNVVNLYI